MPPPPSTLSADDRAKVTTRVEQFAKALTRGRVAGWDTHLAGLAGPVRAAALVEFAVTEMAARWDRGEKPTVEDYVRQVPELGTVEQVPPALILAEHRCRLKAGEHPDPAVFRARFPAQYEAVREQVEAHATGTLVDESLRGVAADHAAHTLIPGSLSAPPGTTPVEATLTPDTAREQFPGLLGAVPSAAGGAPVRLPDDTTATLLPQDTRPPSTAGPVASGGGLRAPSTAGGSLGEGFVSVSQQYELVRQLGRGMFGEVWLARKNPSGIEKAIKVLHQSADRETAKREFRALELIKNLRHPYLLATEDFWVSDNRLHIVMELADGTLRGRLKECQEQGLAGIPEDELFIYMAEAAEGLDYLHAQKITHRDVKPDNILILNGHAKVADFGLARQEALSSQMSFAGTPAYMAPEAWGGEGTAPSDQYSLAFVYVELRQGRGPLGLRPIHEMMLAHINAEYDFADMIGEAERAVLRKAMAKKPEDRYPSCSAFIEELAMALGRSVARRSGRVGMPGPRGVPGEPSARPRASLESLPMASILHSDGKLQAVLDTKGAGGSGAGTITDRPVGAPEQPPAGSARRIAFAALAVGLLIGVAGVVWRLAVAPSQPTANTGGGGEPSAVPPSGGGTTEPPKIDSGPKPPAPVVPAGFRPAAGAKEIGLADGRRVFDWIAKEISGQEVRFRLIPGAGGPSPVKPFYVMESKVWNKLYREGATAAKVSPRGPFPGGDEAPAVSVTADDAAAFAASLGGRLPTPAEWDHAFGLYAFANSPLKADATPRVMLPEPKPTHGPDAGTDVNQYGLRDMAGNGREWTSQVLKPGDNPARNLIVLRGRSYTLARGLDADTLRYEQDNPQTQFAGTPSPYTGFRVVVPLP